jgi:hypothetical protein
MEVSGQLHVPSALPPGKYLWKLMLTFVQEDLSVLLVFCVPQFLINILSYSAFCSPTLKQQKATCDMILEHPVWNGTNTDKLLELTNQWFCYLSYFFMGKGLGWLDYGLGDRGFESWQGLGIFLFTTVSRTALGPTQPPVQLGSDALSLGSKAAGMWSWPLISISAGGQECVEIYLHSHNTSSWRGAQLNHRDNFTFASTSRSTFP